MSKKGAKIKVKEAIALGVDCMFDLDVYVARKAMQKIIDDIFDPQTRKVRVRDAAPSTCFRMTGEQLAVSVQYFKTNHPELGLHFE
jgi:hypothetical protein